MARKLSNMWCSFVLPAKQMRKEGQGDSRGPSTSYGRKEQALSNKGFNKEAINPASNTYTQSN